MPAQDGSYVKFRYPLLMVSMLCLLGGVGAGLLRLGWSFPAVLRLGPEIHGPLMIVGFLGTLICLERAVGLGGKVWFYLVPLLSGVGSVALLFHSFLAPFLFALSALGLMGMVVRMIVLTPGLDTVTIFIGALMLLVGDLLWMTGFPFAIVAFWWISFLLFTVLGERLELSRLTLPPRKARFVLAVLEVVFSVGLLQYTIGAQGGSGRLGLRLLGVAVLGMVVWFWRYDLARRTIRSKGLPRFVAVNVLSGYLWLLIFSATVIYKPDLGGYRYDLVLHTVFLGFVFPMIFAHAPIVFPAVTRLVLPYSSRFYLHVALLQLSTVIRVWSDLGSDFSGRKVSGVLCGGAILLFLFNNLLSIVRGNRAGSRG